MNNKPNDGGSAFANGIWRDRERTEFIESSHAGMSLRDYFAAKALAVIASPYEGKYISDYAREAYMLADNMLDAREETK